MNRYLIVGRGKTGTTVISKTIQNSLGIADYQLEPQSIAVFDRIGRQDADAVVKILYDHWSPRPRLLNAIIHNELNTHFVNLFITRDPRAEIISRLHYIAFPYFQKPRPESEIETWLAIFRRKEENPEAVSLKEIVAYLDRHFGVFNDRAIRRIAVLALGYARYFPSSPTK